MFAGCPEHFNAEGTLSEYPRNIACRLGANCSPCLPLPGKSNQIFSLSSSSVDLARDLFISSHLMAEFRSRFG